MKNKIICKAGLRKNIINDDVFKRELVLCNMLYEKNKGKCCWGKCKDCGVIPLLYKLHRGILLDDDTKIKKIKSKVFKI